MIPVDRPYGDCDECGGVMEQVLAPVLEEGRLLRESSPPGRMREYVLSQLSRVDLSGDS